VELLVSSGLTILAAVGIAFFQVVIRAVSRWRRLGVTGGSLTAHFDLDDWVFWHEWVVAAGATMTFFVVQMSRDGKAVSVAAMGVLLAELIFGLLFVPFGIGVLLCDVRGNIRDRRSAIIANAIGLLFLIAVVAVGVRIYD
jgi:hypothetical protein